MSCKKVMYEEMLPCEFVERMNEFPVAYLPLGTLEWHGLHLPLGSDGIQSRGIFEKLATEIGGIVLPMLFLGPDRSVNKDNTAYYGMDLQSFEGDCLQQLEGSAYFIEDDQFNSLLDMVMHDLSRAGFKIVIGHGHGPSTKAYANRKQAFMEKYGILTYNLWELGFEGDNGIQTDHAAANETSIVMALRPELVDMEQLTEDDKMIAIKGEDPRKWASAARGNELIEKNIKLASQKIISIVSDLTKTHRTLDYHNVKSLLRK